MTRINAGYPVKQLTGKHLMAEHREIKRIPNAVKKGKAVIKDIPKDFCLGPGHVKFFYNKQLYLKKRYEELYKEAISRGYKPTYYGDCWNDIPEHLMNDWVPTTESKLLIEQRIKERLEVNLKDKITKNFIKKKIDFDCIDEYIRDLMVEINKSPNIHTLWSCEGHDDNEVPNREGYFMFEVNEIGWEKFWNEIVPELSCDFYLSRVDQNHLKTSNLNWSINVQNDKYNNSIIIRCQFGNEDNWKSIKWYFWDCIKQRFKLI